MIYCRPNDVRIKVFTYVLPMAWRYFDFCDEMTGQDVSLVVLCIVLIFLIVAILWYLLWKFILSTNPLVRDFFDLDAKPQSKPRASGKSKPTEGLKSSKND